MAGNKVRMAGALVAFALVVASCSDDGDDVDEAEPAGETEPAGPLELEVVSSHPDYVTAGSALVAATVDGDSDLDPEDVSITSDGEDVTAAFETDPDDPLRLVGLLEGLGDGETELTATGGDHSADLTVTNHEDTTGPLFSGEQIPLVECTTEDFGLEPSTPEEGCFAPTEVTWEYVDVDGGRHDLEDPEAAPDDVEMVEVDGEEVPLVIRNERGVLNRAVYQISKLEEAWNERLVYGFGGGCGATFSQGEIGFGSGAPSLDLLREGYAAASATFNTYAVLCNHVISAETVSMVKEHFVVNYGEPVHTIGDGASGGAIQQTLIAQNYPGLLDAIAPSLPFPDSLSISSGVADCRLLLNYYETDNGDQLSEEQRVAINGHATEAACSIWNSSFVDVIIDPTAGCAGDVAYHPEDNPDGLRCTAWETNAAIAGRDPETGFARRGVDNVGVQYGLGAMNNGDISVEEFLDLNEHVGGFGPDGEPQEQRHVTEAPSSEGYDNGLVVGPWGGIPDTPMIVIDGYSDECDFHDRVRAFALGDRLADEDGNLPATSSLWTYVPEECGLSLALGEPAAAATRALDEWLTAAGEHQRSEGADWQEALAATKPESAESRCVIEGGDEIVMDDPGDNPDCDGAAPVHAEPRMVAGAPRASDVLKCELVPTDEALDLYEVELDEDEQGRLAEIFPDGVCDYDQPDAGYGPPSDVWLSFD
jgi:hypothetical protein